jgi:predicted SprT family Zn-dependent metalloprotease
VNLAPVTIEHGERFGKLTVIQKLTSKERGPRYRCGCACGFPWVYARAQQLMRGEVTSCLKCRGDK